MCNALQLLQVACDLYLHGHGTARSSATLKDLHANPGKLLFPIYDRDGKGNAMLQVKLFLARKSCNHANVHTLCICVKGFATLLNDNPRYFDCSAKEGPVDIYLGGKLLG